MKIRVNQKPPSGIVLVVALFIIAAAGIVIASYLTLMASETRNVARSQIWNQCVPVMEAGVEEAMAQIHYCNYSTNLSSNNWTLGTNGYYQKTRTVGTDGSYCVIAIQPVSPPVIYSTAYVPVPNTSTNYISREVRVTTLNQQSGSGGLTAKGTIQLTGGASFDSFNSSVAPYNPLLPGTNAVALTDSTVSGAISISGNGYIYGMAVTGPGGSISLSGNAAIGSTNWISGGNKGVQPNWSANDANVQINDISAPNTSSWIASVLPGQINGTGTNYTYLVQSGNYSIGSLTIAGGKSMGVAGNVNMYIPGGVTVSGSGFIYMAPGATLTMYVGTTLNVSGGGIVNGSGTAGHLTVYGLPTCTSVTYSGSAAFVGTVSAPEAAFTFSGGSGAYGSFTATNIVISGSGGVHYDQALGASQPFIAASWNEL